MRYSTSGMILAAMTIGEAMAGPTHAHLHRRVHEKKDAAPVDWDALDWNAMGIDWTSAWKAGQHSSTAAPVVVATPTSVAPAAKIAATTAAAPAAATTAAKSGGVFNELASDVSSLFAGVIGAANGRTSFGGVTAASGALGDFYRGNVGSPYGSSVILAQSGQTYSYTNTFKNTQSKSITVNIWQKIGPDGQILSGSALAPKSTTLTFTLAPGASKTVAFAENTQVGWAEACSKTAISGAFDTTWGEANFVSTGSGYDVSAIMNSGGSNYKMTITSVEAPHCTSDKDQNMWLTDTQPIGDSNGSCFIAQSHATLTTVMGGYV